jgi:hypothetical protein
MNLSCHPEMAMQQELLEVPTIYSAYVRAMKGHIPTLIWYSTSTLGP